MTKTRVFGLRLDPRQAWAWKRLGQDGIRNLIAPSGACVQCGHRKAGIDTRNGWFCYPCQDALDQTSLLPPDETARLVQLNQELLTQIKRLNADIKSSKKTITDNRQEHQQPLFDKS